MDAELADALDADAVCFDVIRARLVRSEESARHGADLLAGVAELENGVGELAFVALRACDHVAVLLDTYAEATGMPVAAVFEAFRRQTVEAVVDGGPTE